MRAQPDQPPAAEHPADDHLAAGRACLLLVDDDPAILRQLKWSFDRYEVLTATDRASALRLVRAHRPAVVSLDLGLPPAPAGATVGLALLQEIMTVAPTTKVIVVSGSEDRADARAAIAQGAWDFYQKPIDAGALGLIVERAFHVARLEAETRGLRPVAGQPLAGLITDDAGMLAVARMVERVAPTPVSVLLLGESGTGKELLARGLHELSQRATGPFVAINCAAIPETLLESELFGHEKGAFTGASQQVKGKIELAHGGTLFLDEIGDMPVALQAKLLRFVEQRQIERLGGRVPIDVDVRIVCATHQPLAVRIAEGRFRQDLLYRLAGLTIELPPLRARGDDVTLLAQHFADAQAAKQGKPPPRFAADALTALRAHPWPGNVRELANVVQRAVILGNGAMIGAAELGLGTFLAVASGPAPEPILPAALPVPALKLVREQAEQRAVAAAIRHAQGNLTHAAKLLGISRPTLYTILRRSELEAQATIEPGAAP